MAFDRSPSAIGNGHSGGVVSRPLSRPAMQGLATTKGIRMLQAATFDVKARASAALSQSPIQSLRELRVDRVGKTLTLSGRVETFYYKQLAQELVRAIAGDCHCDVVNSVDVW